MAPSINQYAYIASIYIEPDYKNYDNIFSIKSGYFYSQFSTFIETQELPLTNSQLGNFWQLVNSLDNLHPFKGEALNCTFGFSVENELFIKRKDERGIHYLMTDEDGDVFYCRVGVFRGDYDTIQTESSKGVHYFLGHKPVY